MKRGVVFLLCAGCVSIPHLTAAQVEWASTKWPETRADELEHGRSIYVSRCGSCHAAPEPKEVMQQTDADMVKEMADRAKLTPEEQQAVMRFLEAATNSPMSKVAQR